MKKIFGYAAKSDNDQIFLGNSSMMDGELKKGYSIYRVFTDWSEELVATPEEGYLEEKPIFPPLNSDEKLSTIKIKRSTRNE